MTEEELTKKRLSELAARAYNNNYYTYTPFLGLAEQTILKQAMRIDDNIKSTKVTLCGGAEGVERVVAVFGDEQSFGYPPAFPITCIKIAPLQQKFADKLTHRDFLGSLMNLGIERETIGDIIIYENTGYIFCLETMADFITENLTRIRHTTVACRVTDEVPDIMSNAERRTIQISSERLDACVAKAYKLSRTDAVSLIKSGRVYVNGVACESNSYAPKTDEMISVRGHGRFRYIGVKRRTGKGNLVVEIDIYKK